MGEGKLIHGDLTGKILGCVRDVHARLGPGLLETAYRKCLVGRLGAAKLGVRVEVPVPIRMDDVLVECGFRADLIVENAVLVELKSVERLLPIHESQLLTYLKLSGLRVGLLVNFNSISFSDSFRRYVR